MKHSFIGLPLIRGKLSFRRAKKYINRWQTGWMLSPEYQGFIANLKIGDWFNTCDGLNHQIKSISPYYYGVGRNGSILVDIDIENEKGGFCSMRSCGVDRKMSREEVEAGIVDFSKGYVLANGGKTWYGETEEYQRQCERAQKIIDTVANGGHIVDEDGNKYLPGYERT